jgi:glutathione S-transferase
MPSIPIARCRRSTTTARSCSSRWPSISVSRRSTKWSNAIEAGRCYQWTLWSATEIEDLSQAWGYARFVAPEPRDAQVIAAAAGALHGPLSVLDGALTDRHFLAAERFTVADLNVASVLFRLRAFDDLHKYSQVKAWMERCWDRPAARKCLKMREG